MARTEGAKKKPMIYARIDVKATMHPKFIRAGAVARDLWVWANLYCRDYEESGDVTREIVLSSPWGAGFAANEAVAAKLVDVGLFTVIEGGWHIVNYENKNDTKEDIEANREAAKERVQRFRKKATGNESVTRYTPSEESDLKRSGNAFVPYSDSFSNSDSKISSESPPVSANDSDPPKSERRPSSPPPAIPLRPAQDAFGATFLASAWCDGISAATGKPCTALDRFGLADLQNLTAAHAGGLTGSELVTWVRDIAKEYASSVDRNFWRPVPKRCSEWLDGGKPKRPEQQSDKVQKSDLETAPWRGNMKVTKL